MCIRDRIYDDEKIYISNYRNGMDRCFLCFCVYWFKGEAKACLLYTSDAADDLLCVDLGGRRIIKKKKKTKKREKLKQDLTKREYIQNDQI